MTLPKPVNFEPNYDERMREKEKKFLLLQEKLEHERQLRILAEKQLELVKALQQAALQGSQFTKIMYPILHEFINFDKAWLYVMRVESISTRSGQDLPRMRPVETCTFYYGFSATDEKPYQNLDYIKICQHDFVTALLLTQILRQPHPYPKALTTCNLFPNNYDEFFNSDFFTIYLKKYDIYHGIVIGYFFPGTIDKFILLYLFNSSQNAPFICSQVRLAESGFQVIYVTLCSKFGLVSQEGTLVKLTSREQQIFDLLCAHNNPIYHKQIAEKFQIKLDTVARHLNKIYAKMGINNNLLVGKHRKDLLRIQCASRLILKPVKGLKENYYDLEKWSQRFHGNN